MFFYLAQARNFSEKKSTNNFTELRQFDLNTNSDDINSFFHKKNPQQDFVGQTLAAAGSIVLYCQSWAAWAG